MLHTLKQNYQGSQDIWEEGVCIHGLGKLSTAVSSTLLKKISKNNEFFKRLTIITIEKKRDVIRNLIEEATQVSDQEDISIEDLLKPFFEECNFEMVQEMIRLHCELDMSEFVDFAKNINYISIPEAKHEEIEKVYKENKIHFLGMPGKFINGKIAEIKEASNQDPEKIYIDPAKGAHEISRDIRHQVVIMSGPNFAGEMWAEKPTGTNISGYSKEKVNDVMKLIWSDTMRPYPHKNPEAIKKGGEWKNVLAIVAGLLTKGQTKKAKSITMSALFIKMLEWGEKEGIDREDLLDLSGIGDFYLCMNEKSRNFKAGQLIHNIDFSEVNSFDDIIKLVKEELPKDKRTVEGLTTIASYLEDPSYKDDGLIEMFKELSSLSTNKNNINVVINNKITLLQNIDYEELDSDGIELKSKIEDSEHKYIRSVAKMIKEIMKRIHSGRNTEALLISRSIPEIKRALGIDFLSKQDIFKMLQSMIEISLATDYSTQHIQQIIQHRSSEDMPILTAVSEAVCDYLNEDSLKEIKEGLMNRPIKLQD